MKHLVPEGFTVEKLEGETSRDIPYKVKSARAEYFLMATEKDPHLMFVLNSNMKTTKIGGSAWFSDKTGFLRPVTVLR